MHLRRELASEARRPLVACGSTPACSRADATANDTRANPISQWRKTATEPADDCAVRCRHDLLRRD